MSIRPEAWWLVFAIPAPWGSAAFASESGLEEIVVTARKIEERMQDVPMSVQVVSGEYLDETDPSNLFELQFDIPGLVVNTLGGYGAGFSLRGVADQGGSSLSVASYLNGVYLGNSNLAITRLFDMDRIEVVKGPQGTLYGRNSTGGSINFVTRTPEETFASGIEAAIASFDTARVQGFINLPFDKGGFRAALVRSEGDGYIRNTVDDRRFAEDDFWGLRTSLSVALPNGFSLDLMAQHVADNGASAELWLPNPGFLPDPADLYLTTVTLADPFLKTESDIVSANAGYDLGFAMLRSVTGYARSETSNKDDCAGLPFLAGCVREIGPRGHTQWSQEFQLVSAADASIAWLAGAYGFDADGSSRNYLLTPLAGELPQNDEHSTSQDRAFAVYGQGTAQVAARLEVTAGLRYSAETSRVSSIGTGLRDNPTLTVATYDSDQLSWRIGLKYAATEDLLVYADVSTGFKSGGIGNDRLPDGGFNRYKPENLLAWEAGIRSQWLERRLTVNAAAFFYDFEDMQVSTVVIDGGQVYPLTDNAARAEIYGIDSAVTFAVAERLVLSGSVIWLPKRDFVDYRNEQTGDTLSGNKLSRVPEWTATAAVDSRLPLRRHGTVSARVEYNYRSAFFYTKENLPIFRQDHFGLLNIFLRYEPDGENWYLFASGRNLTNEAYFTQIFIQSSPGYPDTWEVGFGVRY